MRNQDKTKEQLIGELEEMHRRIVELEESEIKHKVTKKKFREAEGKFLSIMDNVHDVIFQLSPLGIIKYVNPIVKELYGYEPEKLIGKHLKTTTPISEVPRALDAIKVVKSGKTITNFEIKQLDSKGKILHMEINAIPVKKEGKIVAVQGVMRDITERKKAEEELKKYKKNLEKMIEKRTSELRATNERLQQDITNRKQAEEDLRESEERFRSLVEASPDGITLTDLDGKILMCNLQTAILHGFESKEELIGKSSFEFISPKDQKKAMDSLEKTFQEGTVKNMEYALLKKDGTHYHGELSASLILDKEGKPMAFMAVTRDITEQMQVKKALQEEKARLQEYLDVAGVILVVIDVEQKVGLINKKGCEVLGYKEEEIIGKNWFDNFLPGRIKDELKAVSDKLLAGEIESAEYFENPVLTKDGEERIIAWHNTELCDEKGKVFAHLSSGEDITERKKVEEEKDRLQAQLIQSEKMAGIGTLTSGIAHEFNNLLQIMSGHSEYAQRTKKPEDMEEALGIVTSISDRVSKIINDLLTFSSRDELEKELSSIPELIDFVLSMTEEQLKKINISVVREYGRVPQIEVNQGELQQVFLNMVTNARDAMLPKGGRLEIRIKKVKDNVEISFTDTGIGIEEENLGRVFEPFYTTKGAVGGDTRTQGIGLGLSVSYGIVERHGGMIEVKSEAGKGTTFTIRLPATIVKTKKRVAKDEKKAKAEKMKPKNVLVVDDEEEICKMMEKWLSSEGHKVKSALDGESALKLVEKERFDVIFLDVIMPGIPSLVVLFEMKRISPKTKIVMITGRMLDKEFKRELKEKGAPAFIQKPFNLEDILGFLK